MGVNPQHIAIWLATPGYEPFLVLGLGDYPANPNLNLRTTWVRNPVPPRWPRWISEERSVVVFPVEERGEAPTLLSKNLVVVEVVVRKFRQTTQHISYIQECLIFLSFPWVGKTSRQNLQDMTPHRNRRQDMFAAWKNCIAESRRNKSCAERFWIFQLPTTFLQKSFLGKETYIFFPSEPLHPAKEIWDGFLWRSPKNGMADWERQSHC